MPKTGWVVGEERDRKKKKNISRDQTKLVIHNVCEDVGKATRSNRAILKTVSKAS